jgi:hypothetical protein
MTPRRLPNGFPDRYTGPPTTPPPVRRPGHPDRRTDLDHFTFPRVGPNSGLEPTSNHPSGRVGRVKRDAQRVHGRGCGRMFVNVLMANEVAKCEASRGRIPRIHRESQVRVRRVAYMRITRKFLLICGLLTVSRDPRSRIPVPILLKKHISTFAQIVSRSAP